MKLAFKYLIFFAAAGIAFAQPAYETFFYANYKLGQRAGNVAGGEFPNPESLNGLAAEILPEVKLLGNKPTERLDNFVPSEAIPTGDFGIQLWSLYHVNTPVGAAAIFRNPDGGTKIPFIFGFYGEHLVLHFSNENASKDFIIDLDSIAKIKPIARSRRHFAYKKWNYNLFMTYSNGNVNFYINNQKILELADVPKPEFSKNTQVEMAAYLDNEPMMDMPNLVRYFALYDKMPTENEMTSSNGLFASMIDKGILHPTKFHFNAGPYLNYVTKTSVNLLWETDRQADFLIEYGETSDFGNRVEVRKLDIKEEPAIDGLINEIKLDNLKQNTPYFYKITAMSADGEMIDSGVLTFQTAVSDSSPYTFAVIGDTEARFHINDMISKGIWHERPNFMMIAGDLTDGGMEHHKFEWNYEYFQGMGQVISRIPVFPILGNGEGDVFWYDRYQSLPGTGENYTFKYGNAEFFLMNSNRKEDFAPGMPIYNWLKEQLENSTAKWKFAMFHHAPYSSDEDDYGDSWKGKSTLGDTKIRKITPLFDEYNVDMVFYGHLHAYERSHPIKADAFHEDGTVYVLVGGAGGNLEDFAPTKAWFNQKTHRGHHYVKVDINGGRLDYFMYTVEGNLVDYFTIKK